MSRGDGSDIKLTDSEKYACLLQAMRQIHIDMPELAKHMPRAVRDDIEACQFLLRARKEVADAVRGRQTLVNNGAVLGSGFMAIMSASCEAFALRTAVTEYEKKHPYVVQLLTTADETTELLKRAAAEDAVTAAAVAVAAAAAPVKRRKRASRDE